MVEDATFENSSFVLTEERINWISDCILDVPLDSLIVNSDQIWVRKWFYSLKEVHTTVRYTKMVTNFVLCALDTTTDRVINYLLTFVFVILFPFPQALLLNCTMMVIRCFIYRFLYFLISLSFLVFLFRSVAFDSLIFAYTFMSVSLDLHFYVFIHCSSS